ncbi:MAG: hypothetical protein JNL90_12525 [Planctomycetes bacterium]|nr:hypothetical protein [Planctomycetota bacterium]
MSRSAGQRPVQDVAPYGALVAQAAESAVGDDRGVRSAADEARVMELLATAREQSTAGELDAAVATLGALPSGATDALLFRAFLERQRGAYEASDATLSRLLAANPGEPQAVLQRAYTRWVAGDLGGADADFAALEARRGVVDESLLERARADRAGLTAQRKELEPIGHDLERLVALQWSSGGVLLALTLLAAWCTRSRGRRPSTG